MCMCVCVHVRVDGEPWGPLFKDVSMPESPDTTGILKGDTECHVTPSAVLVTP